MSIGGFSVGARDTSSKAFVRSSHPLFTSPWRFTTKKWRFSRAGHVFFLHRECLSCLHIIKIGLIFLCEKINYEYIFDCRFVWIRARFNSQNFERQHIKKFQNFFISEDSCAKKFLSDHPAVVRVDAFPPDIPNFVEENFVNIVIVYEKSLLLLGLVWTFCNKEMCFVFGPTMDACKLMTSKLCAKEFCKENSIPTIPWEERSTSEFKDEQQAFRYFMEYARPPNLVLKLDHRVFTPKNKFELSMIIRDIWERKGNSMVKILLEKRIYHPAKDEHVFTGMAFCDGVNALSMPIVRNYHSDDFFAKRSVSGSIGPLHDDTLISRNTRHKAKYMLHKTLEGLHSRSVRFNGVLAAKFLHTPEDDIYLLEYELLRVCKCWISGGFAIFWKSNLIDIIQKGCIHNGLGGEYETHLEKECFCFFCVCGKFASGDSQKCDHVSMQTKILSTFRICEKHKHSATKFDENDPQDVSDNRRGNRNRIDPSLSGDHWRGNHWCVARCDSGMWDVGGGE